MQQKTGNEIMDDMIKEPNLDRLMKADPQSLTKDPEAYPALIAALRADRARVEIRKAAKSARKEGWTTDDDDSD